MAFKHANPPIGMILKWKNYLIKKNVFYYNLIQKTNFMNLVFKRNITFIRSLLHIQSLLCERFSHFPLHIPNDGSK